jgi:Tol biopolymer transport system component
VPRAARLILAFAAALAIGTVGAVAAAPAGQVAVPTATSRAVDGRIVTVREERLLLFEAGQSRVVYLAPGRGRALDPAWAPGGRTIAFARLTPGAAAGGTLADRLPTADLMLVEEDGSGARVAVATDAPGVQLDGPAWSPDGTTLYHGYYRPTVEGELIVGQTQELRRTELLTGVSSTLAADGVSPAVSPDGALVAFVGRGPGGEESLRLVPAAGGQPSELIAPGTFLSIHAPRFSPDGTTIAFTGVRLAAGASAPDSSPLTRFGGRLLVAVAEAHGGPWEVWTVPVGGGQPRQLSRLQEDYPSAVWSADGRRLLVQGEVGLYLLDAGSGAAELVTTDAGYGRLDWLSRA